MSGDLGRSSATELIPGNPGILEEMTGQLIKWGASLQLAADGLQRIDTSAGWSGKAADRFRQVFDNQPGKWVRAANAFWQASEALQQYVTVLRWAQGQAGSAITTWNAGAAHHQAAQGILQSAQSQLASAAQTASQAIGKARDMAPPKPGLLSEIGSDLGGLMSSAWHGAEHLGEDAITGTASLATAAVNDPGALAAMAGGLLLTGASAGGEGIGVVLDVTGVGTIAGVPLNVVSAAGMTAGVGMTAVGAGKLAADAHTLMSNNDGGGGGSGGSSGESPKVSDVLKGKRGSIRNAPLPSGSPSWTDVDNLTMDDIQAGARANRPGFRTIQKLLKDKRFDK